MLSDMVDRIERKESDDRMERRERQDLVDRKDFIERTDAGRDCWCRWGELVLGLRILPQQEHCSTADAGRDCCWASWESSGLGFHILLQEEHNSGLRDVLTCCCCDWAVSGLRIFPQQEHGSSLTGGLA